MKYICIIGIHQSQIIIVILGEILNTIFYFYYREILWYLKYFFSIDQFREHMTQTNKWTENGDNKSALWLMYIFYQFNNI